MGSMAVCDGSQEELTRSAGGFMLRNTLQTNLGLSTDV